MINKHHNFLFLLLIIFLGCEKDDICIEGSENTSRITIGFIDYETKGVKDISLNSIRGIGLDSIIEIKSQSFQYRKLNTYGTHKITDLFSEFNI